MSSSNVIPTQSLALEKSLSRIVDHIADEGYAVIEHFLSDADIQALALRAQALQAIGKMQQAAIGVSKSENANIRGDFIHWLEESIENDIAIDTDNTQSCSAESVYFAAMTALQQALNHQLFLGLFELESHFAIYPPGAGYQKHLDQFVGKTERKVSCVLYLNQHWKAEDGGALRLYLEQKDQPPFIDVTPHAGKLVVFLSSDFLHEVLPAKRERISIAGWFRTRSING